MIGPWKKLGLVFAPRRDLPWMHSHASLPTPVAQGGSVWRILFSSRDADNRSHVGYFDIDLDRPLEVLRVSTEPLLAPGPLGHFDDHGVYASSAVEHEGRIHLYTIGWNPGSARPLFYSSIGLAVSTDRADSFKKHGNAPIMARSEFDPCLVTAPMVLKEGSRWRMWYVSGIGWEGEGSAAHSVYHLKYAESVDGIGWLREGLVAIDCNTPEERNIARTCVVRHGEVYHAWFASNSGRGYRIGYACSDDGLRWQRAGTPLGLELSDTGWDSEAMAYPYVIRHRDRWFMFYNGNGFGRDGIGVAVSGE